MSDRGSRSRWWCVRNAPSNVPLRVQGPHVTWSGVLVWAMGGGGGSGRWRGHGAAARESVQSGRGEDDGEGEATRSASCDSPPASWSRLGAARPVMLSSMRGQQRGTYARSAITGTLSAPGQARPLQSLAGGRALARADVGDGKRYFIHCERHRAATKINVFQCFMFHGRRCMPQVAGLLHSAHCKPGKHLVTHPPGKLPPPERAPVASPSPRPRVAPAPA